MNSLSLIKGLNRLVEKSLEIGHEHMRTCILLMIQLCQNGSETDGLASMNAFLGFLFALITVTVQDSKKKR